MGHGNGIIVFC